MTDHQTFAAKLTAALDERGWNQSELARRAGLRRDAVSTYCRGSAVPAHESMTKLARVLGWTPPAPVLKKTKSRSKRVGGFDLQQDGDGFRLRLDIVTSLEQAVEILALLKSDARPDDRQVS